MRSVEIWLVLILSSIPPLRPLFVRMYRKTSTIMSSSQSRTLGTSNSRSRNPNEEDDLQLNLYPSGEGRYKASVSQTAREKRRSGGVGKSVEAREADLFEDNDSQESILPGQIWVTTDTSVRRDPAGRIDS